MIRRVLLVLLVAGCGDVANVGEDEERAPPTVCEAGKVEACPCAGGEVGNQACEDDGSRWGACECPVVSPMASDPRVACESPKVPESYAIEERCSEPRPLMFGRCSREIFDAGVCIRNASGNYFCCPRD